MGAKQENVFIFIKIQSANENFKFAINNVLKKYREILNFEYLNIKRQSDDFMKALLDNYILQIKKVVDGGLKF